MSQRGSVPPVEAVLDAWLAEGPDELRDEAFRAAATAIRSDGPRPRAARTDSSLAHGAARFGRVVAGLVVVAAVVIAAIGLAAGRPGPFGAGAAAASPSPSDGVTVAGIQAWLDAPAPAELWRLPPGAQVTVGATLWDPWSNDLARGEPVFVQHTLVDLDSGCPPGACPSTPAGRVVATEDWPGHYVATITLDNFPPLVPGRIEIGQVGRACTASGCTDAYVLFEIAGVGPPPDAPLPAIATVEMSIDRQAPTVRTGEPFVVAIRLTPRVAWAEPGLVLPARLSVELSAQRGPWVASFEALPVGETPQALGSYAAEVTIAEPGTYVLRVAAGPDPEPDDIFGSPALVVTAAGDTAPTPAPGGGVAGPGQSTDALVWLGVGLLAVVAVALIVIGGWRSRSRSPDHR